jgi:glutaredoxin
VRVAFYTRAGCHLCEDARDELDRLGVTYDAIDVDADPDLAARYGKRVPVIEVAGRTIAEGNLSGVRLAKLLKKAR